MREDVINDHVGVWHPAQSFGYHDPRNLSTTAAAKQTAAKHNTLSKLLYTGDVKLIDGGIHFSNVKITLSFLPDAMIIQIDEKDLHAFSTFIPTILSIYSNGFTRVPVNAVSTWFAKNHMTKTYPSM